MILTVGQKKRARRAALTYYDTMQPDGYADRWDYMERHWRAFLEGNILAVRYTTPATLKVIK